LSLDRREFFTVGGTFVLTAATFSAVALPRFVQQANAAPNATTQAPAAAPSTPATGADLMAELAKAGPDGDIVLGSAKAPVTIIEYASMTCPHCAHFSETTFPQLKKQYIDTGKVRFIFREFPFDKLAAAAFMLARCAEKSGGGSDKYMAVVETLFAKQDDWVNDHPLAPLENIAKQFGFTDKSFKACLTNQKVLDGIQSVRDHAVEKLGVNSTPTFFVNGKKIIGDVPLETLAKEINPYLKTG
jgi:protein-disulfide isomerase